MTPRYGWGAEQSPIIIKPNPLTIGSILDDISGAMLQTEFYKAPESDSRRLMVVLHGLGDSPAGFRWLPGALNLPWMNYLLVQAPDSYYGGFSWYDFAGDAGPGIQRSRDQLFAVLDHYRAAGFPTESTVLFGFSQGCLMTIDVGMRYPHHFAGLVGISGYVFEPEQLLKELSPLAKQQEMLFTHGTRDPMVPCAAVREQVKVLQGAGLQIEWREFVKEHTIEGEQELGLIRDFISKRF